MNRDQALDIQKQVNNEIQEHSNDLKKIAIRNFRPETDSEEFIHVYNRAFITAPDPYRSLTLNDVQYFDSNTTFIAILHGRIVGFIVLIIEPIFKHGKEIGKQGVIAGLGVDPRYRRKKIGFLLAAKAAEFFSSQNVSELVCEVYHENEISYNLISNFGFTRTGIVYL